MGNIQIFDITTRISEGVLSKGIIVDAANFDPEDSSLIFDVATTNRTVFVNINDDSLSNNLEIKKIDKNDYSAFVIINALAVDSEHFKKIFKNEVASAIYSIQYSKEFEAWINNEGRKYGICSASELVNILAISIEDFFTPEMITRNVAYGLDRAQEGSYTIDFAIKGENYPSGLSYYATQSLQKYYSANFVRAYLEAFCEDSRTSSIAGYAISKLHNIANDEKFIGIGTFSLVFIVVLLALIGYIFIKDHKTKDALKYSHFSNHKHF